LLGDWGLIDIKNPELHENCAPLNQIKIIAYKEKGEWELVQKYNIGAKRN
jgi:hypothetical protein